MKINIPAHIFREYDIRGLVDKDLSNDFAYLLGRSFAELANSSKLNDIAIGWDARLSSPDYAQALARGLCDEGVNAIMIGMGPTPMAYFAVYAEGLFPTDKSRKFGGCIQVTGSHNPSDMNGFKLCIGNHTLSGSEIQALKATAEKLNGVAPRVTNPGKISELPLLEKYRTTLVENSRPHMGKRRLKIVCDAGNGVGGLVGPKALRHLGHEVIEMFCEPDGRFPNHHPDPTVLENIEALAAKVKETKADFGIGWDGDADRIGVVDEQGQVIWGDMLTLIYGRQILKQVSGATIIGDVKCSSILFDELKRLGANAVMWKTGHSLVKAKLKELKGELAGEMSGHICFKHRYYGFDDAIYSTLRLAEIVSNNSIPVSELLANLPKTVSTPEIREDCPEELKFKIAAEAQKAFKDYEVITIDGVRVNFEHGWALVRASNTQPVLVLRFEATSQQYLDEYRNLMLTELQAIKKKLAG